MDSLNQWFIRPIQNQFFDFEGRSTVRQYWMFTLWSLIFSIILDLVGPSIASTLFSLFLLFPGLGIGARRLHDIGKSGWWQLLWFIPIIGWIVLIVFLVTKSDDGDNAYGPNPKRTVVPLPVPVPPAVPRPVPTAPIESVTNADVSVDTNLK